MPKVTISNVRPRRDMDGALMDVHDGNVLSFDGRYFMIGMAYTNCTLESSWFPPQYCPGVWAPFGNCGFREDHGLHVYSSADLVSWRFEADALPFANRPRGIYFRPKVVRNPRDGKFVLWINYLPAIGSTYPLNTPLASYMRTSTYIVGRASSPRGPFEVVQDDRGGARVQVGGAADFALLATAERGAYIAYDAWANDHAIRVEQLDNSLTAGLMGSEASTGDLPGSAKNEAPLLFVRNGWFYLAFGNLCCFCAEGGGASLWTARAPLGPWTPTGVDLNPPNADGCGREIPSQNNHVFEATTSSGEVEYIFTADLWRTAPDGKKSHDLQYWAPLRFDDSVTPPAIAPLTWVDSFELDLPLPAEREAAASGAPLLGSWAREAEAARDHIASHKRSCVNSSGIHPQLQARMAVGAVAVLAACWWGRSQKKARLYQR